MDVRRHLSVFACILFLTACGEKSVETVFPEKNAYDSSHCSGEAVENRFIVQWEDGSFTVENDSNKEAFVQHFVKPRLKDIRFIEHDRKISTATISEISESSTITNWGQQLINADKLWQRGIKGAGVKVAVVDSVVDVYHSQLNQRIALNTNEIPNNGIDDDNNGVIDDYYGASFISTPTSRNPSAHGTHVAGVIAADSRYGLVEGVAPESNIIAAAFIGDDGGGSLGDAVLALQYSANRGAKIINASWGGAPCVSSLRNAFAELESKGILIIVASGNDGRDIDLYPEFPASFNFANQITVAATSIRGYLASWSNKGYKHVHLASPGEKILSTVPGGTAVMDGTSMAAPFVSGTAALLWGAFPEASAQQVKQAILESVIIESGHEFKVKTQGRLDAENAYLRLQELLK